MKFDAHMASLSGADAVQSIAQAGVPTVSEAMLVEHVRQMVAKTDKQNAEEYAKAPPIDPNDLIDRRKDAGIELAINQMRGAHLPISTKTYACFLPMFWASSAIPSPRNGIS